MTFASRGSVADGQLLIVKRAVALCTWVCFSCQAIVLGSYDTKMLQGRVDTCNLPEKHLS